MLKKNSGYPAQAAAARTPDFLHILKVVAFSYAVSLVMLVPAALIATFRCFSDKGIALCANLICALGVLLCGFIAGRHSEKGGLIAGAVSGLVYMADRRTCVTDRQLWRVCGYRSCYRNSLRRGGRNTGYKHQRQPPQMM